MYGEGIVIRPITQEDREFYRSIRMQYSLIYRSAHYAAKNKNLTKRHKRLIVTDTMGNLYLGKIILAALFTEYNRKSEIRIASFYFNLNKQQQNLRITIVMLQVLSTMVDDMGIEPTTSALRTLRSPS